MDVLDFYVRGIRLSPDAKDTAYPYNIPAVMALSEELKLTSQVTILIGENGSGKSTLIEAVAVASGFNPEGGSKNFNFSTEDSHGELYKNIVVAKGVKRPKDGFFLRAESYYNVASNIDDIDKSHGDDGWVKSFYGGKSLHKQSHGESFMALIRNRLGGGGLYIFDEPESALSPSRQLELLVHMQRLVDNGSQIIMATHSPILMSYPDSVIYELSSDGIVQTILEDTEHFSIYKDFLSHPQSFINHLLKR